MGPDQKYQQRYTQHRQWKSGGRIDQEPPEREPGGWFGCTHVCGLTRAGSSAVNHDLSHIGKLIIESHFAIA
jgi:hypothetical protein